MDFNEWFEYRNGVLYWKHDRRSNKLKGKKVGALSSTGRLGVKLLGKQYLVHRIIYAMHHGNCAEYVDHIDGNPLNNKIENLRAATMSENAINSKPRAKTKSGVKGVTWHGRDKLWHVRLRVGGEQKSFGYFKDLVEATSVAKAARLQHHGAFARHE
jgi:hypothetical protein